MYVPPAESCKIYLFACVRPRQHIFQSCRNGATACWVMNHYFRGLKCLTQGHITAEVGIEPRALVSESDALPLSHRTVDIIRSLRKEQAAMNFLLKVDGHVVMMNTRYLIVYKNCQARCMHPLGQSELIDIEFYPIHIFKKGRTLSVAGE